MSVNTDTNRIEQLKATVDYLEQQLAKQAKQLRDADRALILAERILSNLIEDWEGRQGVVSARNSIVRYINKYKGKE